MALDPGAMHARIIDNLPEKTGHGLPHWLDVLKESSPDKKAWMALLKNTHGIGHHTATAIIREFDGDVPWQAGDALEDALRQSLSSDARELYDALKAHVLKKPGVRMIPCKGYTGFTAKRQFAVLKPSKSDGLHIGLALPIDIHPEVLMPSKGLGSARIEAKATAKSGFPILSNLMSLAAERDLI